MRWSEGVWLEAFLELLSEGFQCSFSTRDRLHLFLRPWRLTPTQDGMRMLVQLVGLSAQADCRSLAPPRTAVPRDSNVDKLARRAAS